MAVEELYYTPEDRAEDPREHEEWFLRLPEHGKEEMRERWRAAEGVAPEQRARRTWTTKRYLAEGVGLFVIVYWMFYPFLMDGLLLSVVTGFAVGGVTAYLRAGAYNYGWISAAGQALFGILYTGFLYIFPFLICTCVGTMLGAAHTLNRYDFSEC